ncbi:MAG: HAMP domain-containing sensor histidine kinase [Desulfuromonadaceae bacterium]|jgi:signal transduction histidine kinase
MEKGCIAIVGAGKGGLDFLKMLLKIPDINIKYVCDVDDEAPGMLYAGEHGLDCVKDYSAIVDDKEVTLIFEATGQYAIYQDLSRRKQANTSLVGSYGTKVIYSFIDSYDEMNQKLSSYKLHLEKRIIERTEELEQANVELYKEKEVCKKLYLKEQKISEEKTKYLLHATHQLKAPFAAIQSYADVILSGYTGEVSEKTREIVEKIAHRSELLTNVINEMLELAKLKTIDGAVFEEFDILQIANEVIDYFSVVAESRNIKLNLICAQEQIMKVCNKNQINALFSILIENALNYSPEHTEVDMMLYVTETGKLHIEVTDQGIGIPEQNLDKIFNEYFRSNNAVDFMPNGTGLGLAIAHEICRLHNAKLSVTSKVGEGTTFKIDF